MRQVARLLAEDLFEKDEDEEQEKELVPSASLVNSAPDGLYGGIRGFGSNDHRGYASESSTSICPPDRERESGVGRGSHLNRPAWMVPN